MSRTVRLGLIFGAGVAASNLILQFIATPFLPWQLIGLLSIGAWLAGVVAAGAYAGRAGSLRSGAWAAVIVAAVDILRAAVVAITVGTPPAPSGSGLTEPLTPGLIVLGTVAEFMLIGPLAAVLGLVAARLTRASPANRAVAR